MGGVNSLTAQDGWPELKMAALCTKFHFIGALKGALVLTEGTQALQPPSNAPCRPTCTKNLFCCLLVYILLCTLPSLLINKSRDREWLVYAQSQSWKKVEKAEKTNYFSCITLWNKSENSIKPNQTIWLSRGLTWHFYYTIGDLAYHNKTCSYS